jgi:hypothetical protein
MNGHLLDTNAVSAHLKSHPVVTQRVREVELAGHPLRFNAGSYYGTKGGLLIMGAYRQLAAFERLCQVLGMVMIHQAVLDKTGELYAELRTSGQLMTMPIS